MYVCMSEQLVKTKLNSICWTVPEREYICTLYVHKLRVGTLSQHMYECAHVCVCVCASVHVLTSKWHCSSAKQIKLDNFYSFGWQFYLWYPVVKVEISKKKKLPWPPPLGRHLCVHVLGISQSNAPDCCRAFHLFSN